MSRVLPSIRRALLAALITTSVAFSASAHAQADQVQAGHKGMIGLGLIGAELGFVIPTSLGLHRTWSLITLPVVGAAGGAVGGYYLDRANSRAASVSTLVIGLAFAVPTIIITVGSTRYSTDDLQSDTEALARQLRLEARLLEGDGLLRRSGGHFRLAMPGLQIGPAMMRDGGSAPMRPAGTLVGMTLVSGAF